MPARQATSLLSFLASSRVQFSVSQSALTGKALRSSWMYSFSIARDQRIFERSFYSLKTRITTSNCSSKFNSTFRYSIYTCCVSKVFTPYSQLFSVASIAFNLDLTFLCRTQAKVTYSQSQSYHFGQTVITRDPNLKHRIETTQIVSKALTVDPMLLFWIHSFYTGSKVITTVPKLLL